MRILAAALVTMIGLGTGHRADAQATPAMPAPLTTQLTHLQVGARVRAHAPTLGARFEGLVVGTSADTLDLVGDGARIRLPMAAVTQLELHRGRSRGAGAKRGAVWGTVVGLVMGGVTVATAAAYEPACGARYQCAENADDSQAVVGWMALSTVSGTIWGAALGAIVGRERWEAVPVSRVAARSVMVPGQGVGLRLAITTR